MYNKKSMVSKNNPREEKVVSLPIRLIPFYNTDDSTRLQMGAKYIGFQAVPSEYSQIPYCLADGFIEFGVYNDNQFIKRAEEDGVVIYSNPKLSIMVVYYEKTNRVETYEIPIYKRIGQAHEFATRLRFYLKTGEQFEEGDILFEYLGWKNGLPASGYNALTCIGSLNFLNYEDAVIISESFAKRVGYIEENEYLIPIYTYTVLEKNSKDEYLPKVGEIYENGEIILFKKDYVDFSKDFKSYIGAISKGKINLHFESKINSFRKYVRSNGEIFYSKKYYIAPQELHNKEKIVEVEVIPLSDVNFCIDTITDEVIKQGIEKFNNKIDNLSEKISNAFLKVIGAEISPKMVKKSIVKKVWGYNKRKFSRDIKDVRNLVAVIKIKTIYKNEFRPGHKISTSAASKGVDAIVIPDKLMPKTEDGRTIDIFISPLAIPSRMTISQIYEFVFARLVNYAETLILEKKDIKTALNLLKDLISLLSNEKIKNPQLKLINKLEEIPEKDALEFMIEEIKSNGNLFVIVDSFKEPDAYTIKDLVKIADKYGVEIFDTKIKVKAKELYKFITKDKKKFSKLLPEEVEVTASIGYLYIYYLEHVTEHKFNARSTGKYQSATKLPPRGRKKEGGSRIGNDEIAMLVTYDSEDVLDELVRIKADDHSNKKRFISAPVIHKEMFNKEKRGTKPKPITNSLLENLMNVTFVTIKGQK